MWAAALLFVAILLLLAYLDTKKPQNFPPGPKWLPIIGSALELNNIRKKTGFLVSATNELSKQYGPVLGLRIGQDKQVICFSFEAVRQMLTDEDISGRPNGFFYQARTWEKRRGLLFTDEDFWHEQRRFVVRHLRDFGFGRRDMAGLLEEEAQDLVKNVIERMNENNSVIVPMNDLFNISVLNALWTMIAGTRYSPEDKTLKTLQHLLSDLLKSIDIIGCLFSQYPFLRFIAPDFSGYTCFIKTHEELWKFLRKELEHHKATIKTGEPRDLMDVYLETLNSPDRKESFSECQLLAICLDLFIAGSETTSKSLAFAFLYLVLSPRVQEKAQEEIDLVIGRDRPPVLSDRVKYVVTFYCIRIFLTLCFSFSMPYIEALIYESLRMFVGQTLVLPRRALRDTTLQGYFVPKVSTTKTRTMKKKTEMGSIFFDL